MSEPGPELDYLLVCAGSMRKVNSLSLLEHFRSGCSHLVANQVT
jgi:hypothetical protein